MTRGSPYVGGGEVWIAELSNCRSGAMPGLEKGLRNAHHLGWFLALDKESYSKASLNQEERLGQVRSGTMQRAIADWYSK